MTERPSLTDEQLRDASIERLREATNTYLPQAPRTWCQTGDLNNLLSAFDALRAERAKPIQSDGMSKGHVAQAKEIASRFRNADRAGYKGWAVIYQALASIRAEGKAEGNKRVEAVYELLANARADGSAEREKLEAALAKIKGGFIDSECLMSSPPDWKNAFGQLQDIAKTALAKPAESGAMS